jgi:CRP/FNR family transcriptional regulator, anaerobic regulatory protein
MRIVSEVDFNSTGNGGASDQTNSSTSDGARTLERLWVGEVCRKRIELRPQQRLSRSQLLDETLLAVEEGVVALDAVPVKGQRQILDFLMPGDVVSLSGSQFILTVSFRALTNSTLVVAVEKDDASCGMLTSRQLRHQFQSQLHRAHLQQLLVGHLDSEARVASFLFAFAWRAGNGDQSRHYLHLPMSRDDMADYLAINHDTLSRIMRRFENSSLIERISRHAIYVLDLDGLRRISPIASFITGIFAGGSKTR